TRSSRIRNWHAHNQRRKRGPAAGAVTAALAPALNLIVTAATAIAIGRIVGEAGVRISPAIAVNPRVPPGEARGSRRSRNGKTGNGNRHHRVFSAVPHELNPCGNRVGARELFNVQTGFSFFLLVCFFSWQKTSHRLAW